jgi:uncharacterized protein (DUF1800 family)
MLTPYQNKLSREDAIHLLRRMCLSVDFAEIKAIENMSAKDAFSYFLNNASKKTKPTAPAWLNQNHQNPWKVSPDKRAEVEKAFYEKLYKQYWELKYWWLEIMQKDKNSIMEKMTLFWHTHFTTKYNTDDPLPAQLLYNQQKIFRENGLGNFRTLVEKICIDAAMLIFLNGKGSKKESPNENFSRELLELYTTGIGHYTETDVKEGARVFTGWNLNIFEDEKSAAGLYEPYLESWAHDFGSKTYLGKQINISPSASQEQVIKLEINQLVDIILTQRKNETANFVCQKLYKFFIFANPSAADQEVIKEMAAVLISNNWEIKPVLKLLFESSFFYAEAQKGIQFKNPAENIANIASHFDVKSDWKDWVMVTMGMELFNPPNVAGWSGYRKWMDSRTLPFAVQQMSNFVWNQTDAYLVNWIKQFNKPEDPKILTENILFLFFAKKVNNTLVEKYTKILLGGTPDYEWAEIIKKPESAGIKLKIMLVAMIKSPAFHLN